MRQETKHTAVGMEVIYDTDIPVGKVSMHPETLSNLWRNTKYPVTLQGGNLNPKSDLGIGVGSRPSMSPDSEASNG